MSNTISALNNITGKVIGCAIEVHRNLGPGLLESTYQACLSHELIAANMTIKQQLGLPLIYKEIKLEIGYRLDLLVEEQVIVEIKSVDALTDIHIAQVLTYMKLTGARLGLIINFNVTQLKYGIKRLIAR